MASGNPSDKEEVASNIDSRDKVRRYGLTQIISSFSDLIKNNRLIVALLILVISRILTNENVVNFFNAIK